MKVEIELFAGPDHHSNISRRDIQKNIDALQRAIEGKPQAHDFVNLIDTKSILEQIKEKLLKWSP